MSAVATHVPVALERAPRALVGRALTMPPRARPQGRRGASHAPEGAQA
jgi:hypothetical protein